MRKITLLSAFAAAAVLAASAGSAEEKAASPGLKFAGCSISSVAYMKDMAKAFEAKTGVPVEVKGGGVPVGIAKTLEGKVQLGGSCRHLLDSEEKKGAVSTVVGYDMLVFLVHPNNPVSTITMDQLRKVFAGKITNWKELGGPDKKIVVVGRESPDAGVATMFREKVMKGWEITPNTVDRQSTSEIEQELETNEWGIGVSGVSSAVLRKVKLLKLNVVAPDRPSFRNGSYPLARPLYLVTSGKPDGLTKQFIDFVLSADGQKIMGKNAFSLDDFCERQKALTGTCDKRS